MFRIECYQEIVFTNLFVFNVLGVFCHGFHQPLEIEGPVMVNSNVESAYGHVFSMLLSNDLSEIKEMEQCHSHPNERVIAKVSEL